MDYDRRKSESVIVFSAKSPKRSIKVELQDGRYTLTEAHKGRELNPAVFTSVAEVVLALQGMIVHYGSYENQRFHTTTNELGRVIGVY